MEIKTLLKSNIKSHLGTVLGVFVLILLVSLSLGTVLTVWYNSSRYAKSEMDRLVYGDIAAWVSGIDEASSLAEEISSLDEIKSVGIQSVIFTEYEINDQESDSEGQLIIYYPSSYPYKFFSDGFSGYQPPPEKIEQGEVYLSSSMVSMFGVRIGDRVTFPVARSNNDVTLTVAGFYEDPFMGSTMIGMKGFLICEQDYDDIAGIIKETGINSLARQGFMLHISKALGSAMTASELSTLINESTSLTSYLEFTHSKDAIAGFMLTLQNVFTSLLMAFVLILILASMAVLSHSISSTVEQDYADMGILKTIGFTGTRLRAVQLMQYLITALLGILAGTLLSLPSSSFICRMTVTTTGLLIPSNPPIGICIITFTVILLLMTGFVWLRTGKISRISPVDAIRGSGRKYMLRKRLYPSLQKRGLNCRLALRQLLSCRSQYIGACLVAVLMVFFASLIGRVDAWLGPNGEGLMDAFNPADLHIAAQPMSEVSLSDLEKTIESYTPITDFYDLAMPSVCVNGVDMTVNVITEPSRFHILNGRTCLEADEVVLTEFVASDLGVVVGDTVTLSGALGSIEYKVSGIYQCANDMGMNAGLSRKGYLRIGVDTPNMWCRHYFIFDSSLQPEIMQALSDTYGGDVYLHENSWPGLFGILSAMKLLMVFLYATVSVFVLVATLLTAKKLINKEQRDLCSYRMIGFSALKIRLSFALRFGMVSLLGSSLGTALSALLTDPLVAMLMRMEGISNFSSHPGFLRILFPGAAVTLLFYLFAFISAKKAVGAPLTRLSEE